MLNMQLLGSKQGEVPHFCVKFIPCNHSHWASHPVRLLVHTGILNGNHAGSLPHQWWNAPIYRRPKPPSLHLRWRTLAWFVDNGSIVLDKVLILAA